MTGMIVAAVVKAESKSETADLERALFEGNVASVEKTHTQSISKLSQQYIKALESKAEELQGKGDLDSLLAVKGELTRFNESGGVPATPDQPAPQIITDLQGIYRNAEAQANQTRRSAILRHATGYLAHLEDLQVKMTKDGKLEEAVKVRDEVVRIRAYIGKIESQTPGPLVDDGDGNSPSTATRKEQLMVSWDGASSHSIRGADGRASLKLEFDHQGGNKMTDGVLHLHGGRTLVNGLDKLLERCMASNELSVQLKFETESLEQGGHARILSYSLDGHHRNFTLCQVNHQIILRLRTTETGGNGTGPEVTLGKLKEGTVHNLVFTYRPGELLFYLDGEAKPVQTVGGDFSNWEAYQLLLGNEWKDDRPWKGRIHQFAIYTSVLEPRRAVDLTK